MNPHPARSAEQPAQAPVESIAALMLLPIVLAFGVWLRFQHFGAIEYNIDQAYPIWQRCKRSTPRAAARRSARRCFRQPALDRLPARPGLAIARTRRRVPVHAGAHHAGPGSASPRRKLIGARAALIARRCSPPARGSSRTPPTWCRASRRFSCAWCSGAGPGAARRRRRPGRRLLVALIGLALVAHTTAGLRVIAPSPSCC